jgi:glycosyltransferase involved in cell wall biosynthesis
VTYLATSDVAIRYLLLDQLVYLKAEGHDVSAISGEGPNVEFVRAAGIPLMTVPFTRRVSPFQDLRAGAALVRHFARTRPDLIHTQTPKAALLGQWSARVAGVRYRLHTMFGLYLPAFASPRARAYYLWLERVQMAPAHLVLSQNAEDIETCRQERLYDTRKMRLLGNGIDVERFHPRNVERARAAGVRERLGIPAGHRVVGMVARLVREKGYLELFDAIPLVRQSVPDTTFIAIGGTDPEKPDRIEADDPAVRGLGTAIRLLGHRDDVEDLYAVMDVFVLPSHREGFPRSPLEAAATGVPIVVTDVRGCRETLVDDETGLLVPLGDHRALASAITTLLLDDRRRRAMGVAGRALAEARFDQRAVFRRVGDVYTELARGA